MRRLFTLIPLLLLAFPVAADELFEKLSQDATLSREVGNGVKILKEYYKWDAQADEGKRGAATKRDEAMAEFLAWLAGTKATLGTDLRAQPGTVLELFDRARVDDLVRPKVRGKLDYVKVDDARGMERFEYAIHLPRTYDRENDARYPLIVSLHERVINQKHPAFRGNPKTFQERSRKVIFDNWIKSPIAESAIIIAPTGNPNGFTFDKDPYGDLQALYRALGAGLSNYRVDWNRVFLEVHGSAIRVICEQSFVFAGFIVRDRQDDRRRPPLPEEEFFLFQNLNGTPLCYVADQENWEKVGKPLADALTKTYAEMGKPENLLLLQGTRDANEAIQTDDAKIAAFIGQHTRPFAHKKFVWRYFSPTMLAPMPVVIIQANYHYAEDQPLATTAGRLALEVREETYTDPSGNELPYNLIDVTATESQVFDIQLYDGFVNLDLPVSVRVNGALLHDKVMVERSWSKFVEDVLPRRFFMLPYVGSLNCAYEEVPQYKPPEEPATPAEGEEATPPEQPEGTPPESGEPAETDEQ